jgi:hypothetical protein
MTNSKKNNDEKKVVKKGKRGRKPKNTVVKEKPPPKKRGRKPKGGKIIINVEDVNKNKIVKKPNIILHLKCSSEDIENNENQVLNFKPEYLNIQNKQNKVQYNEINQHPEEDKTHKKDMWEKIKQLKINLHNNDISDKRSNCFWCTCPFDNPPIHIPRQERNGMIEVYGNFCSPECAVAHLKKEPIDTSTLWERYSLLNNVYSDIYNYETNIKPAPCPHYTLDKFYGTLTIKEYRKLLNNKSLLLVVEKPLTKVLPELFEENNDYPTIYSDLLTERKSGKSILRLSRKLPKNSKKSMLSSNFNLT